MDLKQLAQAVEEMKIDLASLKAVPFELSALTAQVRGVERAVARIESALIEQAIRGRGAGNGQVGWRGHFITLLVAVLGAMLGALMGSGKFPV